MSTLRPDVCPVTGDTHARLVFSYDSPPQGEIGFRRPEGEPYRREVWQFTPSNHFVSRHAMSVATDYSGDYVNATYGDDAGLRKAFDRVVTLPPDRSDNVGRIARIQQFAIDHFGTDRKIRLLDVGAGLGVFPYAVKKAGWHCTAIDPDQRAVIHMRECVGVEAVRGDFMSIDGLDRFDIVTFNKVLEHIDDPIAMLRRAHQFLNPEGFVYLELPDGEVAAREGAGREEFFVEHVHVFSFVSIARLAERAGFTPIAVERLQEPSTKFTLRAFLAPSFN